jgi:hypothetical protein
MWNEALEFKYCRSKESYWLKQTPSSIIETEIFVDPDSRTSNIELGTREFPFKVSNSLCYLNLI